MTTVTHVEHLLYGGRSLVGYTDGGERIAGWPEVACEAIRASNHLTNHGAIPAPTVYRVLGDLKGVGHLLPQALEQLCRGLQASLVAFEVCDHRRDPAESVTDAVALLGRAARKAADLGQLLEDSQAAISDQGYHTDDHPSLFDDDGDLPQSRGHRHRRSPAAEGGGSRSVADPSGLWPTIRPWPRSPNSWLLYTSPSPRD